MQWQLNWTWLNKTLMFFSIWSGPAGGLQFHQPTPAPPYIQARVTSYSLASVTKVHKCCYCSNYGRHKSKRHILCHFVETVFRFVKSWHKFVHNTCFLHTKMSIIPNAIGCLNVLLYCFIYVAISSQSVRNLVCGAHGINKNDILIFS